MIFGRDRIRDRPIAFRSPWQNGAVGQSRGAALSSLMLCWADFTIATRGYSFRKGQVKNRNSHRDKGISECAHACVEKIRCIVSGEKDGSVLRQSPTRNPRPMRLGPIYCLGLLRSKDCSNGSHLVRKWRSVGSTQSNPPLSPWKYRELSACPLSAAEQM
jgi:hypothetical protein